MKLAELKREIGNDKIENVIKYLSSILYDSDLENDFLSLSNQWKNYVKNRSNGVYYNNERNVEKNRIIKSMLDFIDGNKFEIENQIVFCDQVVTSIESRVNSYLKKNSIPYIYLENEFLVFKKHIDFSIIYLFMGWILPLIFIGFGFFLIWWGVTLLFLFFEETEYLTLAASAFFGTMGLLCAREGVNVLKQSWFDYNYSIRINLMDLDVFVNDLVLNLTNFKKIAKETKKLNQNIVKIHILEEENKNYILWFPPYGGEFKSSKGYTNDQVNILIGLFKEILRGIKK